MREIKFKVYYKTCHPHTGFNDIDSKIFTLEDYENGNYILWVDSLENDFTYHLVSRVQYTGLKDKNGKEIYEDDIIEFKAYTCWHKDKVRYLEGGFYCYLMGLKEEIRTLFELMTICAIGCEIKGNIYENPELLEFKK